MYEDKGIMDNNTNITTVLPHQSEIEFATLYKEGQLVYAKEVEEVQKLYSANGFGIGYAIGAIINAYGRKEPDKKAFELGLDPLNPKNLTQEQQARVRDNTHYATEYVKLNGGFLLKSTDNQHVIAVNSAGRVYDYVLGYSPEGNWISLKAYFEYDPRVYKIFNQ